MDPTALRILCDAISDGVILFDARDRVTFANDGAYRLLSVRDGAISGLSSHNVFTAYLNVTRESLRRLRAGELVGCPDPDGTPEAFFVQAVKLPTNMPGGGVGMGVVIRDRRLSQQLRRTEDALLTMGGRQEHATNLAMWRPAGLLDHDEILRVLARETQRAGRDAEQLSVLVLHGQAGFTSDQLSSTLTRARRAGDRAGLLHDSFGRSELVAGSRGGGASDPGGVAGGHWGLLILSGTGRAGVEAVVLRLRSSLGAQARELGLGGATMRVGASWGELDQDTADTLLLRAHEACCEDRKCDAAVAADWRLDGRVGETLAMVETAADRLDPVETTANRLDPVERVGTFERVGTVGTASAVECDDSGDSDLEVTWVGRRAELAA
ncbi:MAG: PAS domain-containing protein [Nannocystaceae bacterium]